MDLLALFASAFLAATIFPAQSEGVLVYSYLQGERTWPVLLSVATAGNTLGAIVNWVIGRFAASFKEAKWFPASPKQLQRARDWYARYGVWSLWLSWVPFIGDPLTVVAGLMRTPLWLFTVIVALAKTGRYAALLWLAS